MKKSENRRLVLVDPPVVPEVGRVRTSLVNRLSDNALGVGALAVERVNVRIVECIREVLEAAYHSLHWSYNGVVRKEILIVAGLIGEVHVLHYVQGSRIELRYRRELHTDSDITVNVDV